MWALLVSLPIYSTPDFSAHPSSAAQFQHFDLSRFGRRDKYVKRQIKLKIKTIGGSKLIHNTGVNSLLKRIETCKDLPQNLGLLAVIEIHKWGRAWQQQSGALTVSPDSPGKASKLSKSLFPYL